MAGPSKTGTGFTNLRQIIGANKNAKVGQALGSGVADVAQGAKTGLNKATEEFQTGLGGEKQKFGEQQGQIQTGLSKLEQDPNQIGANEAQQFAGLRNTVYKGPQGINNAENVIGQANRAESTGALTRTAAGKQELLKQFVANKANPYSQGQRQLDTLILGQGPQAALKNARRETVGLGQKAQATATGAQEEAKSQAQAIEDFKRQTGEQLGQKQTETSKAIDDALGNLKARTADQQTYINRAKATLAGGGDQGSFVADLRAAGLPEDQVADIAEVFQQVGAGNQYGGKYTPSALKAFQTLAGGLSAGETPLTRSFAASDQQRSKMNAIARLAGGQEEFTSPREQAKAAGLGKIGNELGGSVHSALDDYYKPYEAEMAKYQESINNRNHPAWEDPRLADIIAKKFNGASVDDFKKTLVAQSDLNGSGGSEKYAGITGGIGKELVEELMGSGNQQAKDGKHGSIMLGGYYGGGDFLKDYLDQEKLRKLQSHARDTVAARGNREAALNKILAKYR